MPRSARPAKFKGPQGSEELRKVRLLGHLSDAQLERALKALELHVATPRSTAVIERDFAHRVDFVWSGRFQMTAVAPNGASITMASFQHGDAFGHGLAVVWSYAGVNAFGQQRDAELAMHPTVKPVALVEDAIKDVSRRGGIVLDPFGGSGSTLIAAERCGRSARLIEIDPLYCDVIVKRYEAYTGKSASLAGAQP